MFENNLIAPHKQYVVLDNHDNLLVLLFTYGVYYFFHEMFNWGSPFFQ